MTDPRVTANFADERDQPLGTAENISFRFALGFQMTGRLNSRGLTAAVPSRPYVFLRVKEVEFGPFRITSFRNDTLSNGFRLGCGRSAGFSAPIAWYKGLGEWRMQQNSDTLHCNAWRSTRRAVILFRVRVRSDLAGPKEWANQFG